MSYDVHEIIKHLPSNCSQLTTLRVTQRLMTDSKIIGLAIDVNCGVSAKASHDICRISDRTSQFIPHVNLSANAATNVKIFPTFEINDHYKLNDVALSQGFCISQN
jgi:UDP-N-acetylglucosamine pyrophosphorylase